MAQIYELWQQTYPREAAPCIRLGFVSATLGNWGKKLEEWREALRLDPNGSAQHSLLALAYKAFNRLDEAEALYEQAEEQLVEVLDDGGNPVADGESGTAVVTVLHARVMPFVRYVLGDRVVKGPAPCSCGAPFGTLRSIDGREIDRLQLGNGKTGHAFELLNILVLSDTSWIRQYQLVQDEAGFIDVRIWPMRAPDPGVLEHLRSKLQERTAGTVIRMKLVDGMELDSRGKFHMCRCSLE